MINGQDKFDISIRFRVNRQILAIIDSNAEMMNMKRSEYLRFVGQNGIHFISELASHGKYNWKQIRAEETRFDPERELKKPGFKECVHELEHIFQDGLSILKKMSDEELGIKSNGELDKKRLETEKRMLQRQLREKEKRLEEKEKRILLEELNPPK